MSVEINFMHRASAGKRSIAFTRVVGELEPGDVTKLRDALINRTTYVPSVLQLPAVQDHLSDEPHEITDVFNSPHPASDPNVTWTGVLGRVLSAANGS